MLRSLRSNFPIGSAGLFHIRVRLVKRQQNVRMSKNNSNNLPLDSVFFYMSKKTAILITVALVLGAVSLYLWLDSMPPSKIQIASRNIRVGGAQYNRLSFDPAYPMTRVKVISVAEAQTNEHPHVLWELVPADKPVMKDRICLRRKYCRE